MAETFLDRKSSHWFHRTLGQFMPMVLFVFAILHSLNAYPQHSRARNQFLDVRFEQGHLHIKTTAATKVRRCGDATIEGEAPRIYVDFEGIELPQIKLPQNVRAGQNTPTRIRLVVTDGDCQMLHLSSQGQTATTSTELRSIVQSNSKLSITLSKPLSARCLEITRLNEPPSIAVEFDEQVRILDSVVLPSTVVFEKLASKTRLVISNITCSSVQVLPGRTPETGFLSCIPEYRVVSPGSFSPVSEAKVTLEFVVFESSSTKANNRPEAVEGSTGVNGIVGFPPVDQTVERMTSGQLILSLSKPGYIARKWYSHFDCSSNVRTEQVELWPQREALSCLRNKWFYLDPGHGIAYSHERRDSVRVQEWYVADRALQETKSWLLQWGVPASQILESRTAGVLFDQYYWAIELRDNLSVPSHQVYVRTGRGDRLFDDLVHVLNLDTEALRRSIVDINSATLNAHIKKQHGDSRLGWTQNGQLEVYSGNKSLGRLKVPQGMRLFFDQTILRNLVTRRLADETIDNCLRFDTIHQDNSCAEITLPSGSYSNSPNIQDIRRRISALLDRDYIKRRIIQQIDLPYAFTFGPSRAPQWLTQRVLPTGVSARAPQPDETRPAREPGVWCPQLLAWNPARRQQHWRSVAPHFSGRDGAILSLHFNGTENRRDRGVIAMYGGAASKTLASIVAKYIDWLNGGFRRRGYGADNDGRAFFAQGISDVFLEADFYNAPMPGERFLWELMAQPENFRLLGHQIADALAEGLCYPQQEGWTDDSPNSQVHS